MSDNMNDIIVSGLGQSVPDLSQARNMVDQVMAKALEDKDPEIAFNTGVVLFRATHLAGMALAKLAHDLKRNWNKFQVASRFEEVAVQYWPMEKVTLDRYIRIWEFQESDEFPKELLEKIAQKDLKDQVAIATTWASGYEVTEDHLEQLAEAADNQEVLEILRDVKGVPARSNALTLKINPRGEIWAWTNEGSTYVGYLEVALQNEDETLKRAIRRIISNSNIKEE